MMATSKLFWDQLLQFIEERQVVPIVGRDLLSVGFEGRSVGLYPLLAKRLAEYLEVSSQGLPIGGELNEVCCRYLANRGEVEHIYPALKLVMPKPDELEVPKALRQLAEIEPLDLFVSTTFDSLLEVALDQTRFGGQERTRSAAFAPTGGYDLPKDSDGLNQVLVYYLFGQLSSVPFEYAVTEEDTLEFVHALQSETGRPQALFDSLGKSNLLILGSSFGGWLAQRSSVAVSHQRRPKDNGRASR